MAWFGDERVLSLLTEYLCRQEIVLLGLAQLARVVFGSQVGIEVLGLPLLAGDLLVVLQYII